MEQPCIYYDSNGGYCTKDGFYAVGPVKFNRLDCHRHGECTKIGEQEWESINSENTQTQSKLAI